MSKKDYAAKQAFAEELKRRGHVNISINQPPASDLTSEIDNQLWHWEIKSTEQEKKYFGAATITEWECALNNREHYRFVTAQLCPKKWVFHEYTLEEFLTYSYIPPFKTYFTIPVGVTKAASKLYSSKRQHLNEPMLLTLIHFFKSLRVNCSKPLDSK